MKDRGTRGSASCSLAQRAGIEGSRVYEVDKSVDTKTVNAYVTGLGSTKRIVLWDTILARLEPDQVLFVTAHEMGHFVLAPHPDFHTRRGVAGHRSRFTWFIGSPAG